MSEFHADLPWKPQLPWESFTETADPTGQGSLDAAPRAAEALTTPLELPPLAQLAFPGDRVALAVAAAIPAAADVVAGLVQALIDCGVSPGQIALLATREERVEEAELLAHLPETVRSEIFHEVHQPEQVGSCALVGPDAEGNPVCLNRHLVDSDLVIPVDLHQPEADSPWGGIYPAFSDAATQRYFAELGAGPARRAALAGAARLFGFYLTVRVVPSPAGGLAAVVAGEPAAVERRAAEAYERVWGEEAREPAPLVVALIEGGPEQHNWRNFARALTAAAGLTEEGGSVVIAGDFPRVRIPDPWDEDPFDSPEEEEPFEKLESLDRSTLDLLQQTLESRRVYLVSRLDRDFVEELGLGHVAHVDELRRLGKACSRRLLLRNAQYAAPPRAAE